MFRARLLMTGAMLLAAAAPARAQSGFTALWPTAGALVPAGQPITVTWTGGAPSATVDVVLIDQEAWAVYQGFGVGPNTGSRVVTIPPSYGPSGTCGRTFRFYIEDVPRTTWTYGGVFTVVCGEPKTVDVVLVGKSVQFVQTSDSEPIPEPEPPGPNYGGPFSFQVEVAGSDVAGMTPPNITVPAGSGILEPGWAPFYNGGVLGFNGDEHDQEWKFGAPNFNNFGAPSQAIVDNLFLNGLYTVYVQGAEVKLNLTAPTSFGPAPAFTLTGGAWVNGKYVVDVRNPVTITSSRFEGYRANANGAITFGVFDSFAMWFASDDPATDSINFTINACELVSGNDYQASGAFVAIVDYNTGVPGIPTSQNIAYHSRETEFVISAVGGPCDPVDTTPPVIHQVSTNAPSLWPPDHKMVPITVTVVATDDRSAVTTRIVAVSSNEPDEGLGDGDMPDDVELTGEMTVTLRAERSGKGGGRVYTITVEAADEAGNKTARDVQVIVPHSQVRRARL